jgi:hypothetical protein
MKIFNALLNSFTLLAFLTVVIIEVPSNALSQAPTFLSVIDGLPLMPGLREDTNEALSFDTAIGRIAEITASGAVEADEIFDYYAGTLPQLGWKLETLDRYVREGEVLNIHVMKRGGDSGKRMVFFRLSPAGTK